MGAWRNQRIGLRIGLLPVHCQHLSQALTVLCMAGRQVCCSIAGVPEQMAGAGWWKELAGWVLTRPSAKALNTENFSLLAALGLGGPSKACDATAR